MILICYSLIGLLMGIGLATPINSESNSVPASHHARGDFSASAFTPEKPRPDLHNIQCYACVMEECPEVNRYPANTTIWTKCYVQDKKDKGLWHETVDGCYISTWDFSYYPHRTKRDISANPICDEDKANTMPNNTVPHAVKRMASTSTSTLTPTPTPTTKYVPAIVDPRHDKKCLTCADTLCEVETKYLRNASIQIECWTVSTMGPGEVISYPKYDERWIMTKEGCYLALSEVIIPECDDVKSCMPYCEPPPHYWATVKDPSLGRVAPRNDSGGGGYMNGMYMVDVDCWVHSDEINGNNTWYKGSEFYLYGQYWIFWWPKASLGKFGGTGEPPTRCPPEGNSTEPERHTAATKKHRSTPPFIRHPPQGQNTAVGHAAPRGLQVVYAVVNTLDTRCRLCPRRVCAYYTLWQPGESMEFTCFVYGSVIDGSNIWFKSAESIRCYVPRRYVTLNGGSSITYCRGDGTDNRRSLPSTANPASASHTLEDEEDDTPSLIDRAPTPQVSDPSQSENPPKHDSCQETPAFWEELCYNNALACCVKRTEVGLYWPCSRDTIMAAWRDACRDLRTQTNCTMAARLGNQMEGCEGGDVYRDPGKREARMANLELNAGVKIEG